MLIARIVANREAFEAKFAKMAAKESEYVEAMGVKAIVHKAKEDDGLCCGSHARRWRR